MRKIGELPGEGEAMRFHDALYVFGIENDVEREEGGAFSIWVHDDDQRAKATELLVKFRKSPNAADWQDADKAGSLRREAARENARRASKIITHERMEYERNYTGITWVPLVLAILSIAATILAGELGILPGTSMLPTEHDPTETELILAAEHHHKLWERLSITRQIKPRTLAEAIALYDPNASNAIKRRLFDRSLPEIRSGEVWRLFTPIFVHFGILHLVFNIMWLRDLGSFVQGRFGAPYLIVLVLSSAAVSNLVQLAWAGPMFGGLSGVNYALFGFLWMRGKADRTGFWQLQPYIVHSMMIWFFLCILIIPNVANAAHAAGLIFGGISGFLTGKLASLRKSKL